MMYRTCFCRCRYRPLQLLLPTYVLLHTNLMFSMHWRRYCTATIVLQNLAEGSAQLQLCSKTLKHEEVHQMPYTSNVNTVAAI